MFSLVLASKKFNPDLLAVYYEGVDSAGHLFMKYAPPKQDWVTDDKYEMYQNVVTEFHKYQDGIIGEHLKQIDKNRKPIPPFLKGGRGIGVGEPCEHDCFCCLRPWL